MIQAQIFIDADDLKGTQLGYEFILQFLIVHNIKGATVFRGRLGYGENQYINRPNNLFSFDQTPIMITFIDDDEKVKTVLTELRNLYRGGFIVTHQVEKW
ncbi:DUF190 domain-containing protein [Chryseobacterium populi]|uniref:Uncharacterized protein n=1 Tax=Chryseobacterium populi TaxID=1144316 RepID=J3CGW5_9FLAO|nr:DUF190 domain-containing protein [Chryseobacterium populi]EJL71429.1 hypothetical protein PMI13_02377 [Chryseobacterium populi]